MWILSKSKRMRNGQSYYILCVLCWSIILLSCQRKIDLAEIDVAEAFISTLCDTVIGDEYPHSFLNPGSGDALIYLEKECYDDFDRFVTDIPNKMKHIEAWEGDAQYEPISAEKIRLIRIDTIANGKYIVHVRAGKRFKRTIELEVTENNLVKANLHGKGIGGRYKFNRKAGGTIYVYRTEYGKSWAERNPPGSYNIYDTYHEPIVYAESSDIEHHNIFYVLKKKGKNRSLITYVQGGIGDYTITGWVDNKYIVQDEEHKCPYEPSIHEYLETGGGVICLLWFFMAGGAFSGASATASSPNGVAIFFF